MKSDHKYRWKYVANTNAKSARKFIMFNSMARLGNPQSEWCAELWGSTNEAIAPPLGSSLCLAK